MRSFLSASLYYFKALSFVKKNRILLKYMVLPLLINIVLVVAIFTVAVTQFYRLKDMVFESNAWYADFAEWVIMFVLIVITLIVIYYTFTLVGSLIAIPFTDVLSEKVDQVSSDSGSVRQFVSDSVYALKEAVKLTVVKLIVMFACLPFLLVGFGGILLLGAGVIFAGIDYLDLSMARRRMNFAEKKRFLVSNFFSVLGFGAATYGLLLIPFVNFFVIPLGAVAGTLLYCDIERSRA